MNRTTIALRNLDPRRGGRAELTIDPPEFLPARLSVSIRRGATSKGFLGPEGWQQVEHLFQAETFAETEGKLVLVLGPEVVDNELRDFDVVEITFPEVGMVGQVVWEGITRTIALAPEAPPPPPSPLPPPPPPLPGPEVQETEGGETNGGGGGGGGGRGPLIAGAILLLLLLAGGGYWLTRDEGTPVVAVVPPVEPVPTPPPPTPEPPTPDPVAPPAVDPLEAAHGRGLAALEAGDCATAQTELRPGLDAGYGPTLLLWAERQDSVGFEACLTETSNDIRALANYQKACEADTPDVTPALQALLDELKRRADQGDAVAEEVLRVAAPKAIEACAD